MRKLLLLWKDIVRNRNSIGILCSIAISLIIPIVIFTVSNSFFYTANKKAYDVYGYFDNILYRANEMISDLTIENQDIQDMKWMEGIEEYGLIYTFEQENNKIFMGYFNPNAIKLSSLKLIAGTYPQKKSEIALCKSVLYKMGLNEELGQNICIGDREYQLVGIIEDYAVVWNKPLEISSVFLPNALLSKEDAIDCKIEQCHLLLKNSIPFSKEMYNDYKDMVSNTNRVINNESGKYNVPIFVYVLTTICNLILNTYIFIYYFESEKRKIAILRCIALTKNQSILYIISRLTLILIVGILLGFIGGIGISNVMIQIMGRLLRVKSQMIFSIAFFRVSVFICILTMCLSFGILLNKIVKLSPLDIFRNQSISKKYKGGQIRNKYSNINLFRIAGLDLKLYLKKSCIVVLLIAFSITLAVTLTIYMKNYSLQKADIQGRMPLTFDYEFLTQEEMTDDTYLKGEEVISVKTIADVESIFYLPNHKKMISDTWVKNLRKNRKIDKVNEYLEVNDLFLCNAPEENDYLSIYMNDQVLPDEVVEAFDIKGNTRGIQFCGYSGEELLAMQGNIAGGNINLDKILSGEEIILVAPMYEYKELSDGSIEQRFITTDQYQQKENQFKDTVYKVGDTIKFMQFTSKHEELKGYLSEEQVKTELEYKTYSAKIGAIIYERIAWFDNLTQPPTAYTIYGLNETIQQLGLLPTSERVHIYLKNNVDFLEFEPEIRYYQDELGLDKDIFFRNNAAEMQEFRRYQLLIEMICKTLIALAIGSLICIIIVEDKITLYNNQRYYGLLRLSGLSQIRLNKVIIFRAIYLGLIAVLLSALLVIIVIKLLFGSLSEIVELMGPLEIGFYFIFAFLLLLGSAMIVIGQLRKQTIVQMISNEGK